jgi:hypothetical protein
MLLAPVALSSLLLGKWQGCAIGMLAGAVEMVHSTYLPYDFYEMYFASPLNSVALFALFGLLMGALLALACRLPRRALGKDGKAILSSDRAKKKADLMARVSVYLDKIIAKQKAVLADKRIKLRVCYDYLRKNYPYRYVSHFMKKDRDFDLKSVEVILDCGYADCHPYAFTFAYLSNALGFSDITVYSWFSKKWQTGHSWVRIGNRVYDVSLGRHNRKSYELFGMGWSRYCRKYSYYKIKAERHLDKL